MAVGAGVYRYYGQMVTMKTILIVHIPFCYMFDGVNAAIIFERNCFSQIRLSQKINPMRPHVLMFKDK